MKASLHFETPEKAGEDMAGTGASAETDGKTANGSARRLMPFVFAGVLSLVWLVATGYAGWRAGLFDGGSMALVDMAALVAGVVSPIAVVWLVALVFQRTDPLLERRLAVARTMDRALAPVEQAEKRLDQLLAKLRHDVDHIEAATELAGSRIAGLENRFRDEISELFSATADAEAKATSVQDVLKREREAMAALQEDLKAALDRTDTTVSGYAERIASASEHADEAAGKASKTLAERADGLVDAATLASEKLIDCEMALDNRLREVDRSSYDVAERVDGVTGDLAAQLRLLEDRMDSLGTLHKRVMEDFSGQSDRIAELAEKTERDAERIGAALDAQSADLSDKAGRALGASDDARAAFERQAADLDTLVNTTIERARDGFKQLAEELEDQARRTEGASRTQAEQGLAQINRAITDFEDRIAAFEARADDAGGRLAESLSGFRDGFDREAHAVEDRAATGAQRLEALARSLSDQAEMIAAAAGEAAKNMGEAGTRMDERSANLGQSLEDMRRRIEDVADRLAEERDKLAATSEESAGTVLDAADRFRERSDALSESAKTAAERLDAGSEGLAERIERIDQAGTKAGEALVKAAERLQVQSGELMDTLEQSSDALGAASGAFAGERERISQGTDETVAKLDAAAEQLSGKLAALKAAGDDGQSRLDGLAERFAATSSEIIEAAKSAEASVKSSQKSMQDALSGAIGRGLRDLGQTMDTLNTMFKAEVEDLEERVTKTLEQSLEDLRRAAADAGAESERMSERLAGESDKLVHRATSFLNKSEEIERRILAQSRDEFVRTSSLLIESLQSASVDINKILDTEVPDDVWQRYLSGDRSIFSRRTVKLGDRRTRARIAERFESDLEFRDTVLKFFRDFEGLMEQVMTRDKHSALSVTLISSEMGKLYILLAQSLKKIQ